MKTLLLLIILSNSALASNTKIIEPDKYLQESIALAQHFVDVDKSTQGIEFFTVGADGDCSYSSIQAAIDDFFQSPFPTIDIRIATNKTYLENIVIGDASITLTGGYADCSVAAASGSPGTGQSLINANNNGTVLTIQGTSQRRTIAIKNIRMINGQSSGAGGGLLSNASDVALLLENVDIRNNEAGFGGGIAIVGGNTDLVMRESLVFGNTADYGGGVYCSGVMSSVNVANHSGIVTNFANSPLVVAPNGRGGGAYISGCYFAIFTGSFENNSFTGMDFNSAENNGGALYVENSIVRIHGHQSCGSQGCLGDDINPMSFRGNQSNFGDGSVLYSKNSDVKVNATWMEGNTGNSLFYLEQSSFVIERLIETCWDYSTCNLIENNTGVVLKGLNNDGVDISSVNIVNNNDAVFEVSSPTTTSMTPPAFRVEGSMINSNGLDNDYLFDFNGTIDIDFIHNTVADNLVQESIIRTDFNPNVGNPSSLEVHSSIIDNSVRPVYSFDELDFTLGGGVMHITVSACFLNETNSISSSLLVNDAVNYPEGPLNSTADPELIDRENGYYHLSQISPAIDYFNTSARASVLHPDIDFDRRGINSLNVNGIPFFYHDVGADESTWGLSDLIFKNGFE